jgi:pyruvate dehydrogenase E1 component beta subunit
MTMKKVTYRQAINEALFEELERDPRVVLFGEDVGTYGGVFKVTDGLKKKFGSERVFDTPIAEAALMGAATGAAVAGLRPVVEIMFMDWIGIALDQLVNQTTMIPYIWEGIKVPLVLRTQGGSGSKGSCQHTKSLEAWLYHIPGLVVAMPSTPYDAKGLLKSAIRNDNPVAFVEHKMLYPTEGEIPEGEYTVPLGKASVKREGKDITIVALSKMVVESLKAAKELEEEGISVEVVDPVTIKPLDMETIAASVKKTNRVIVVNEAFRTGAVASDITAQIQEHCFDDLDGPILRVTAPDVQVPYSPALEQFWLPGKDKIRQAVLTSLKR